MCKACSLHKYLLKPERGKGGLVMDITFLSLGRTMCFGGNAFRLLDGGFDPTEAKRLRMSDRSPVAETNVTT